MRNINELKREALIMANVRRIIKRTKLTQNWVLYMDIFGVGSTSAYAACESLGLDPDGKKTSSQVMYHHIDPKPLKLG